VAVESVPILSSQGDRCGQIVSRVAFDRIAVMETRFVKAAAVPRHHHEFPHFLHVLHGGFEVGVSAGAASRTNALGFGDAIFHEAGEVHSGQVVTHGGRGFVVELNDCRDLHPPVRETDGYRRRTRISSLLTQIYRESRINDSAQRFAMEGLALLVMAALRREAEPCAAQPPAWMGRARQVLRDTACGTHTIADLSHALGVDGKEITIAFRKYLRCTPAEYQRTQRLEMACTLLATTNHAIGRIAADTGFCDQAYMCHEFKRTMNCTPTQYRTLMSKR